MATQTAAAAGPQLPDRQVTEREARFLPGLRVLVAGIVGLLAGVALAVVASHQGHGAAVALVVLCVLIFIGSGLALRGLTSVIPGQARVVQLFGRYRGTIRDSGLQWVNPFTRRIAVSTRIRNQESAQAKVNDADGNPIEIAAVVVWQVADTASATYSVRRLHAVRHHPDRDRGPAHRLQLPLHQPPRRRTVAARQRRTRSPAGSPPRSPRGSHPLGYTSSNRG